MKTLVVHFVIWAVASSIEEKPFFTFHAEESSLDGSPSLSIHFPNGISDKLILSRHADSADDLCHYIGHLEKEQGACVAMTGCIGQDDLDFTIYSQHLKDPILQLSKEGSINVFDARKVTQLYYFTYNIGHLIVKFYSFRTTLIMPPTKNLWKSQRSDRIVKCQAHMSTNTE